MTATTAPTNYLSTAFYSQYNLILLGGSALFSLAAASPLPLAAGVGAELVWLGLGSRLGAFRRRVDERLATAQRSRLDDEISDGMRGLGTEHAGRLASVGQSISAIASRALGSSSEAGLIVAMAELEQLRPVFLRFCQIHERLSQRLQEMALNPPEQEVALLSQAYAAEKDLGARFTLHQSIKLAQKKQEQESRMLDMRRAIELKLSLVEQALGHLYNQQQLGVSAAELSRDVHNLVAQVGTPSTLEGELNDVGASSLAPPSVAPSR